MSLIIGTSSELWTAAPYTKAVIYGKTGAGKTRWLSRAPKPLILLFEPQGLQTIASVRDDAVCCLMDSWQDFQDVFEAVKVAPTVRTKTGQMACAVQLPGTERPSYFQTLGIDSLTDLQARMIRYILKIPYKERFNLEKAKTVSTQQYGKLWDVMAIMLSDLRDMPCNVIVTCLAEEKYDDDSRRRVVPDLVGKAARKLGGFFNAMGYATQDAFGNHVIVWKGDSRFNTKPGHADWPRAMSSDIALGSLMAYSHGIEGVPMEEWDDPALVEGAKQDYPDRTTEDNDQLDEESDEHSKDEEDNDGTN